MDSDRKIAGQSDVDISALRKAAGSGEAPRFWRGLEELADTPEFRNHKENEFPHGANDPERKTRPTGTAESDGGLRGVCRAFRLHEASDAKNRSLRAPAGGNHSRQAAVLCDGGDPWRRRHWRSGRKQHGEAHEDRGQSRPSGQPGRDRRICAGLDFGAVRSGPLAGGNSRRAHRKLGRVSGRAVRGARSGKGQQRRRA